jgi:uncharacterized protein
MFRKSVFLVVLLFAPLLTAHADDASKLAKIEELFKVSKMDRLTNESMKLAMDQVNSGMMQQLMGVQLSANQQQKVSELSEKVANIVKEALSWDKLEPDYAKLYAATYTEEEIDGILAFYKSPAGQAMVEKSPTVLKQASAIAQDRMKAAVPEIQKLMKDYITDAMSSAAATEKANDKPKE